MEDQKAAEEAERRARINAIQASDLSAEEKAKKLLEVMTATASSAAAQTPQVATANAWQPSFRPDDTTVFGCAHYVSKSQILAPCCNKWYPCRQCHDAAESHALDRYAVKTMVCQVCTEEQPASNTCNVASCAVTMSDYYCDICHLWEGSHRRIYHCNECRICRVGEQGSYYHCSTCNTCLNVEMRADHKCIENVLHDNCVICQENLFTSTVAVQFLPCGHPMHPACLSEYARAGHFTCPTCHKSITNLKDYWQQIDDHIANIPVVPEYAHWRTNFSCNDCDDRQHHVAPFAIHGYYKCPTCGGYNTTIRKTIRRSGESAPQTVVVVREDGQEEEVEDDGDFEDVDSDGSEDGDGEAFESGDESNEDVNEVD